MKDDYIKIRFTAAEKKQIKEMADNSGLTISSYIRYLVAKERELTNEIERIRRREKRTTISEREKETFRYFVAKERKEKSNG